MTSCEKLYCEKNQQSRVLYERAQSTLPGANTRSTLSYPPYPFYAKYAQGCRVVDVDGNERIDFMNNYTSYILGHSHPEINKAISEQIGKITAVAAPTESEILLSEEIKRRLPSVELLRFCNSGTEAVMLCIRAARAFTKREKIAKIIGSYHGSHDYSVVTPEINSAISGIPSGVTKSVLHLPLNDIDATRTILEAHAKDLAAVLIEPIQGSRLIVAATRDYLQFLRDITHRLGALLIFDEVISFRVGYGGAQGKVGVLPDLTALGKIVGGGLPIGAFGGSAGVMSLFNPTGRNGPVLGHGGTYNANPLTMVTGLVTLRILTPHVFERLETQTRDFCERLRKMFAEAKVPVRIHQEGSIFMIHFSNSDINNVSDLMKHTSFFWKKQFHLASRNRGVMLTEGGMGCLSVVMEKKDLDQAFEFLRNATQDVLKAEKEHANL